MTGGGNGTLFRLSAQFLITDGNGTTQVADGTGDTTSLQVALAPGGYRVAIADSFALERSVGGQPFQPVSAVLASPNPLDVFIQPGSSTFISYQFLVANDAPNDSFLNISFGVAPQRGQLVGTLLFDVATGAFTPYLQAQPPRFAAPYIITGEGSRSDPPTHDFFTGTVGFTVLSDSVGAIAALAPGMTGGFLTFAIETKPDDGQRFQLSFTSSASARFTQLTLQTDDLQPTVPVNISRIPNDPVLSRFRATIPFQLFSGTNGQDSAAGRIDLQFLP